MVLQKGVLMYEDVLNRIKQLRIQSVDEFEMYEHLAEEFEHIDEALEYLEKQKLLRVIKTGNAGKIVKLRSGFNV